MNLKTEFLRDLTNHCTDLNTDLWSEVGDYSEEFTHLTISKDLPEDHSVMFNVYFDDDTTVEVCYELRRHPTDKETSNMDGDSIKMNVADPDVTRKIVEWIRKAIKDSIEYLIKRYQEMVDDCRKLLEPKRSRRKKETCWKKPKRS